MTNDVSKGDRLAVALLLGFISLVGCVLERPAPIAEEGDASVSKDATNPPPDGGAAPKEPPKTEAAQEDAGPAKPTQCASFTKDVLPAIDAAGCGAVTCHGTRLGSAIRIEPDNADLTYAELTHFTIGGKAYVKIGGSDLDASTMHCHLAGKCGVKMPPRGGIVPPALIQAVDRWLACGAAKN